MVADTEMQSVPAPADVAPCRTLYVRNLPDKLPTAKLRTLLHAAFSPHGGVTWIAASKAVRLRGQAFVTFESVEAATAALRAMHGAPFVGKTMSVSYAREVSDKASEEGAKVVRRKRKANRVTTESGADEHGGDTEMDGNGGDADATEAADPSSASEKAAQAAQDAEEARKAAERAAKAALPPNKILFAEGLGGGVGADELSSLFGRFGGLVEVRAVPGKRDICFVEYGDAAEAAVALSGLQGHMIGEPAQAMVLSFARK
jgi:RNA recognition motif-containing protein